MNTNNNIDQKPETLTKKDITRTYVRWHFANEIPHSFEKYVAPSLLYAMMPILKKLYKDPEELKKAYKRQLLFFNTQLSWGGGVITGLMASMEAQRAAEQYNHEDILMSDDLLYNTKAGLMGALAGIGDAIDSRVPCSTSLSRWPFRGRSKAARWAPSSRSSVSRRTSWRLACFWRTSRSTWDATRLACFKARRFSRRSKCCPCLVCS